MLDERFWSKVVVGNDDECMVWIGSIVGGYGHFRVGNKVKKAHRLVWEDRAGPIPDGLVVMHKCDNRACVNLRHLSIGTVKDNNKDRDVKGRHVALKGEQHGMARLMQEGVIRIRALTKRHNREIMSIARELGVSSNTVRDVMNQRTWNWL